MNIKKDNYNWYAIYTKSRTEKKVYQSLQSSGIEPYRPLVKNLRQWSDRKKWVEEPLFRSYIFVFITQKEYFKVLNTHGIVRYITFEGKAVKIPPQQIEAVKTFISSEEKLPINIDKYKLGNKVEIIIGPMKGLIGNLVEISGKHKVRIEIDGIGQSVFVKIPVSYLKIKKT